MNKTIFMALLGLFAGNQSFSQGLNISADLGYGMSAGSQVIGVNIGPQSEENVVGSFGQGVSAGINLNYMFNSNLGVDLGLGVLMGKEYEVTYKEETIDEMMKLKGSMFRIMPGVRLSMGEEKSLIPFGRFGLVIGVGAKLIMEDTYTENFLYYNHEYELSQGTALGWFGAFGLGYKINDKVRFNAELLMINQSWAPGKLENTVNSDGELQPDIDLVDELNGSSARKRLTTRLPFGSIGLNAGIQMNF